jgi:hypothetical protein
MKHCIDTQLNLKSILETTATTYKFKKKVEREKIHTKTMLFLPSHP